MSGSIATADARPREPDVDAGRSPTTPDSAEITHNEPKDLEGRIDALIRRLEALQDGDLAVAELVACGGRAVPALRALLFKREPSGIFVQRCRAVEALAALGGRDVLIEFLVTRRDTPDAVEQAGDDAIMNAAARALGHSQDERAWPVLLQLARERTLAGVVEALARFGRSEAIPHCIDALGDDLARAAAETALREFGASARPALIEAAAGTSLVAADETESSLRRRRTAVALLSEIGVSGDDWVRLRDLMDAHDPNLAVLACRLCLDTHPEADKGRAVRRLSDLLATTPWPLSEEIKDCLGRDATPGRGSHEGQ